STGLQGDSVDWTEGSGPVLLDLASNATVADIDSANFDGGTLTISITAGLVGGEDQLGVQSDAEVTVLPGAVIVDGNIIATYSGGGAGGGDLVFNLGNAATPARVAQLMQAITYTNTGGDNPTDGDRTVTWTLVDGDGVANGGADTLTVTSTVNVQPVDDAPAAVDDAVSTDEATPIASGDLFADNGSGPEFEPDGPPLAITEVNGVGADVGTQIALASGALLTVNADGTFSYDPNDAFNYL